MKIRILFFGTLFGFLLSRSGATHYDLIANMFLLREFHLVGVIGTAIVVAGVGMALFKRFSVRDVAGQPLVIAKKPSHPGNLWGGLLFGVGWALTGTCPGTALSQVGEGHLTALFTLFGCLIGTSLFVRFGDQVMGWLQSRQHQREPMPEVARPGR